MEILETWVNKRGEIFAIGRWAEAYVAMWEHDGELFDFGGSPGLGIAKFDSLDDARMYLLTGFEQEDDNPDVFLEMLRSRPK